MPTTCSRNPTGKYANFLSGEHNWTTTEDAAIGGSSTLAELAADPGGRVATLVPDMEGVTAAGGRGSRAPLKTCPAAAAGLFSSITYLWVIPLFRRGLARKLKEDDLYQPLSEHESSRIGRQLEECWQRERKGSGRRGREPSLLRALVSLFGAEYMWWGLLVTIVELCIRLPQPIFLGRLVAVFTEAVFTEGGRDIVGEAWLWCGLVVLSTVLCVIAMDPFWMGVTHLGMRMRVASCSLIYRKVMRLNRAALSVTTPGQVVNLLSNDVNRLDMAPLFGHFLWLGPVQTIIITVLLIQDIGAVPAVVGVVSLLVYTPLQVFLGKKASAFRMKVALCTDERVRLMNEIINAMQVIKMYAWETPFRKLVDTARKSELKQVKYSNFIRGTLVSFIIFAVRLAIFLAILAFVLGRDHLTAEMVFKVTAYFNILNYNMQIHFPRGISFVAEGLVTVKRLQKVMMLPEVSDSDGGHGQGNSKGEVSLVEATAKWYHGQFDNTLTDVSMHIAPGSLVAIVGAVGAGKSSVLNVILGELPLVSGAVRSGGTLSYAGQDAWLFAGTVRQNILFGAAMDGDRYQAVLDACALRADLAAWTDGDLTVVGERGVSLSGGQRARINLARAVYREADVYLLDDPLSAVDAHVSAHLFDTCLSTLLAGKTRILVTHQLQYLTRVDTIFVLSEGRLVAHGTYDAVKDNGLGLVKDVVSSDTGAAPEDPDDGGVREELSATSKPDVLANGVQKKPLTAEKGVGTSSDKVTSQKMAGWKTFHDFFRASGSALYVCFVMFLFFVGQVLAGAGDYWVTLWVRFEHEYYPTLNGTASATTTSDTTSDTTSAWWPPSRETCVVVYAVLAVATALITWIRSLFFFHVCVRASRRLHDDMFGAAVRASMRFFNTTPSGSILNRFSKDMGAIDEVMPLALVDALQIGFTIVSAVVLICLTNPILAIPIVVVVAVALFLRHVYMTTSTNIKHLEANTRSPVFSHVNATLSGLATARVFHMEDTLIKEFDRHQDLNSSASYLFIAATRAFGYWLDWLCAIFIACVTFSFLIGSQLGTFGGDVGLAITQALGLMGVVQYGIRIEAEVETHMVSVERVMEYKNLPSEASLESPPDKKPPKAWPVKGCVEFKDVSLAYDPAQPPVLKGVNFTVTGGEKVGVVGRTGAGKSSLVAALFRLEDPQGGVVVVDGVAACGQGVQLGVHDLRRALSIIPQQPVVFSGTMRRNLDPFDEHPDDELWAALKEVELEGVVEEMNGGLETGVQEGGANLSVGQRQLICLARAIVRNNRILVLDEATSNVDPQTDALIQRMIRSKFSSCTVITIAHRLNTIMDSDKVLVMDAGRVVEFDHPYILLSNKNGSLRSMVEQVGGATAQELMAIAAENFKMCQKTSGMKI